MVKLFFACAILLLIKRVKGELLFDDKDKTQDSLVSVVALLRHGDRAPYVTFPNDKFFDLSYWPMGHGHLTNKGKDRAYQLGKWLRSRYDSFLPQYYSPSDVYVRSTDADRCLVSASVALASLYPATDSKSWNLNHQWQPIPIHTKPFADDEILGMRRRCDKYKNLYGNLIRSDHFKNITSRYSQVLDYVSQRSGWINVNLDHIKTLHTIFDIYKSYNKTFLPEWYNDLDKKAIQHLAAVKHESFTHTRAMKRLVTGPFWSNFFDYFDRIIKGEDLPKFIMLVAHDTTTVALLNSMGLYDSVPPAFGATVIWELRKDRRGHYYVYVLYKRGGHKLQALTMRGCKRDCEYEKFKGILEPVTVDLEAWEKECMEKEFQEVDGGEWEIVKKLWFNKAPGMTSSKPFFVT